MSCYKAVCFDLFDTIITFNSAIYNKIRTTVLANTEIDPDGYQAAWDKTSEDALDGKYETMRDRFHQVIDVLALGEKARDLLPTLMSMESKALKSAVVPVPGMTDLFMQLLSRKKRLAIISNCSCIGPMIIKSLCWQNTFDECVFSFAEKIWKPEPDIYLLACDRLGFPANEVAFVSDGDRGDLTGASDAGMDPIRFDPTGEYSDYPLPPGCYSCNTLESLKKRLFI